MSTIEVNNSPVSAYFWNCERSLLCTNCINLFPTNLLANPIDVTLKQNRDASSTSQKPVKQYISMYVYTCVYIIILSAGEKHTI